MMRIVHPFISLAISSLVVSVAAAQTPQFLPQLQTPVGPSPQSAVCGDLNGDGIPDLIAANSGSNDVSVLLGSGFASFGAPVNFSVGVAPKCLAAGDVNGDGKLDIVTANSTSNDVSVLYGLGSGSFAPHAVYAVGVSPKSVAIADLNGDGISDLATANSGSNNVSILFGLGAGTLAPHLTLAVGSTPESVAIGNLDGNATLDLVTANRGSDTVSILLGTGAGSFGAPSSVVVFFGAKPNYVAIGDLSGEGNPDLAVVNSGCVAVLFATAPATYGSWWKLMPLAVEGAGTPSPRSLAFGDLNGDGKTDLTLAGANGLSASAPGYATILIAKGGDAVESPKLAALGAEPRSAVIADLNGDGAPDLLTANALSNDVSVLLNSITLPGLTGVVAYGTGTSGCMGQLGLYANSLPSVGNSGFAIAGGNAPRNALGLTLGTEVQDLQGSDPFFINVLTHFALTGATELLPIDATSGPSGEQFIPLAIPNLPSLAGKSYYFQTFWVESADLRCTHGLAGLESSKGLAITIQP